MPVNTDFALAIGQGIAWVGATTLAAPTGATTALATGFADLGAITTAGITENASQTRTDFKRWGNVNVFKSVITDQKHTFDVSFLESNPNVLSLYYRTGTAPTPDATSKELTIVDDTTGARDKRSIVFDLLDGTNKIRFYLPAAEVTATKNPVYKTDSLIEYGVTITAYPNTAGIAVQRFFKLNAIP